MYDAIFYMSHFMQGISIVQKNGVERKTSSSSFFFHFFWNFSSFYWNWIAKNVSGNWNWKCCFTSALATTTKYIPSHRGAYGSHSRVASHKCMSDCITFSCRTQCGKFMRLIVFVINHVVKMVYVHSIVMYSVKITHWHCRVVLVVGRNEMKWFIAFRNGNCLRSR